MTKGQRPSAKRKRSSLSRRSSTSRSHITRTDMAALEQLDRLLELQRRQEQLAQMEPPGTRTEHFQRTTGMVSSKRLSPRDLPPGIVTSALSLPGGGRVYRFTHEHLGMLGNLILSPAGIFGTRVSIELAPGDPEAPEWAERYELFNQVVTICLGTLPGGDATKVLPPVEEARTQQRLYQRFIACEHSIEMFGFAKSLTEQEYQQCLVAIQTALITATPTDRIGIEQRLGELQFYWGDLHRRPSI